MKKFSLTLVSTLLILAFGYETSFAQGKSYVTVCSETTTNYIPLDENGQPMELPGQPQKQFWGLIAAGIAVLAIGTVVVIEVVDFSKKHMPPNYVDSWPYQVTVTTSDTNSPLNGTYTKSADGRRPGGGCYMHNGGQGALWPIPYATSAQDPNIVILRWVLTTSAWTGPVLCHETSFGSSIVGVTAPPSNFALSGSELGAGGYLAPYGDVTNAMQGLVAYVRPVESLYSMKKLSGTSHAGSTYLVLTNLDWKLSYSYALDATNFPGAINGYLGVYPLNTANVSYYDNYRSYGVNGTPSSAETNRVTGFTNQVLTVHNTPDSRRYASYYTLPARQASTGPELPQQSVNVVVDRGTSGMIHLNVQRNNETILQVDLDDAYDRVTVLDDGATEAGSTFSVTPAK